MGFCCDSSGYGSAVVGPMEHNTGLFFGAGLWCSAWFGPCTRANVADPSSQPALLFYHRIFPHNAAAGPALLVFFRITNFDQCADDPFCGLSSVSEKLI